MHYFFSKKTPLYTSFTAIFITIFTLFSADVARAQSFQQKWWSSLAPEWQDALRSTIGRKGKVMDSDIDLMWSLKKLDFAATENPINTLEPILKFKELTSLNLTNTRRHLRT